MDLVLKNGITIEDKWYIVGACDEPVPIDFYVLPLPMWQQALALNSPINSSHGFWMTSEDDISTLSETQHAESLSALSIIAIKFSNFTDGRGFSTARLLRERYNYLGELRAFGHIIPDQLFMLQRCGFDAFVMPNVDSLPAASDALKDFSNAYQVAADQRLPLFRRRDLN